MTVYPLHAVRALALIAARLDTPNGQEPLPGPDTVLGLIERLGAIQIDTLQMVSRAHYLTLWSRLGGYEQTWFDRLANDAQERRIFEGWFHAACFLPISEYRYQLPRQRRLREDGHHWYTGWIHEPGNQELISRILEKIRLEGAMRATNLEGEKRRHGTWWDWRPEKMALEHLYSFGDLMISGRVNFQRVYDLTERVLPAWVNRTEPSPEECDLYFLEFGAKALGICLPRNAADYTWMKIGQARPLISKLLKNGILIEVQGETLNGTASLIVHRDNLPVLEKASDGEISASRTTFLNPFDNLWWAQGRDEAFWNFRQRLEAYYPAHKRVYGYYCMPILHNDRLVGRFDPKLERKSGLLRLKSLYLEPGVEPNPELVISVASTLRDFMKFHQAVDLQIEKSDPAEFGEKLLQTL